MRLSKEHNNHTLLNMEYIPFEMSQLQFASQDYENRFCFSPNFDISLQ